MTLECTLFKVSSLIHSGVSFDGPNPYKVMLWF